MSQPHIVVCHPNEQQCREIVDALKEHESGVKITGITDLRSVGERIVEQQPTVVVVGVDSADDPTLRTVEVIKSREEINAGILVVSQDPSRDLLVACMRAGCDELVEFPINPKELGDALSRLYQKKGAGGDGNGQITAVYSAKGGTGNTMIATNLVAMISRCTGQPNTACIMDLNPQFGDVALMMDIREFSKSVPDVCEEADRLDEELLRGYTTQHDSGAAVLPASLDTEQGEDMDPAALLDVLELVGDVYPHVILDLPHSLDTITLAGMDVADEVFVICDMILPSIHNTQRAVEKLHELDYDNSTLKLVINRYYESNAISVGEISEHVGMPVHWLVPYDSAVTIEGANSGRIVDSVDRNCDLTRSLRALARATAGMEMPARKKKKKKFSFFGLR